MSSLPPKPWSRREMVAALRNAHAQYQAAHDARDAVNKKLQAIPLGDPSMGAAFAEFEKAQRAVEVEVWKMLGAVEAVLGISRARAAAAVKAVTS